MNISEFPLTHSLSLSISLSLSLCLSDGNNNAFEHGQVNPERRGITLLFNGNLSLRGRNPGGRAATAQNFVYTRPRTIKPTTYTLYTYRIHTNTHVDVCIYVYMYT